MDTNQSTTGGAPAPLTLPQMAERLDRLALDVTEIVTSLNRDTAECDCCGRASAIDLTQFKAGDAMAEMAEKLRRWGRTLREHRDMHPRVSRRLAANQQRAAEASRATHGAGKRRRSPRRAGDARRPS